MKSAGNYIAGKWIKSQSGQGLQAIDPVYKLKIWEGEAAGENELKTAVREAKQAFFEWSAVDLNERHLKISLLIKEIENKRQELSLLIAQESGRPIWLIEESLSGLIYHLASLSNENHRLIGNIAICGSAVSLNYIAQAFEALLYGNAVILYSLPGSHAALEKMMQCWEKLNVPKGLLQLLHGNKEGLVSLAKSQEIDGLIFEGSANMSAMLRLESAEQAGKYLYLRSPSLNPLIIKNVANIDAAAYQAVRSAFLNSGQESYAAKRLIIGRDAEGDKILEAIVAMTRSLRIAAYDAQPQPFMSSMAYPVEAQQVLSAQTHLQRQGVQLILPMKLIQGGTGLLCAGIALTSPKIENTLSSGPLLQVIQVESADALIKEANRYPSLAAGIISDNEDLFKRYVSSCRSSQLYHNSPMQNPGRFQSMNYPTTQILAGNIGFSQPLPGIKLKSHITA